MLHIRGCWLLLEKPSDVWQCPKELDSRCDREPALWTCVYPVETRPTSSPVAQACAFHLSVSAPVLLKFCASSLLTETRSAVERSIPSTAIPSRGGSRDGKKNARADARSVHAGAVEFLLQAVLEGWEVVCFAVVFLADRSPASSSPIMKGMLDVLYSRDQSFSSLLLIKAQSTSCMIHTTHPGMYCVGRVVNFRA